MTAERQGRVQSSSRDRLATTRELTEAVAAGDVGLWRWDLYSNEVIWLENMEAIHRLPPGSFGGTPEDFFDALHPEDRERVRAEVERCLAAGARYAVQFRLAHDRSDPPCWVESRGRVALGPTGKPVMMTGISQEISAQKHAEQELALRARQQEAIAHLGEAALAGVEQEQLFREAAQTAAELVEADFVEILELSQDRETLLLRAAFGSDESLLGKPVATSAADTQIGMTLRASTPVLVHDYATEQRFQLPERLAALGVQSGASITIAGTEGNPFGAIAVYCKRVRCISRTDVRFLQSLVNVLSSAIRARQDHERSELLIGELRHRVGNLFSLVQALHRQTGQNARDARDLEMKFGARLASLATAHSLILEGGWQRTSLRALLERALAPYIERVSFSGTDVRLPADAAFSFSMALHEMATNANKYGALSDDKGRLHLETRAQPDALGEKLVLVWDERDGPPPQEASIEGFGSKLISQVVERQLGGKVERVVEPNGLRFILEFPIS